MQVSYPGVYIREVPSGVRTITGVSTSVAAFVGMAARGRLGHPTRVLSYAEFERIYSNDGSQGELPLQVQQFFLNGGQEAFVLRIAEGFADPGTSTATQAQVVLSNAEDTTPAAVLTIRARDAGVAGNALRVQVDYGTRTPGSTFNLTVWREVFDPSGAPRREELERFVDLTMREGAPRFVEDVLRDGSRLVEADVDPGVAGAQGMSVGGRFFANEAAFDTALGTLVGTGTGSLRIRVGNSPTLLVRVDAATADRAGLETRIAAATNLHVPTAPDVRFDATRRVLIVEAQTPGEDVVITAGDADDITEALQLGLAAGGMEVGAFAHARPRPNGLVWPGFNAATPLDVVDAITDVASVARPTTMDVDGPVWPVSLTPVFPGTAANMDRIDPADAPSLIHYRSLLGTLATQLSNADWRAEVHGERLRLLPTTGDALAGMGHTLHDGTIDIGLADVNAYGLQTLALPGSAGVGTSGADGNPPTADDYGDAFTILEREVDLFNLLVLPRSAADPGGRENVWGAASAFCHRERAFLLVDPPADWNDREDVVSDIEAMRRGMVNDHAALYWPRVELSAGGTRIDPSGSIAGLMARTDATRGVWKAPAGLEATLRAVRGVQVPMSDPDNGVINPLAVNALRSFPNGIVSWGARTMDGFDGSGNDDYKYVPVRRLALYVEESLVRGLRFAIFEPNDEPLWRQIRLAAGAFMHRLFRQGAFAGAKAGDAYYVKADRETTTQNDINLGIVNVLVGFAPLKPAEFVVIQLQQMAGQVQT